MPQSQTLYLVKLLLRLKTFKFLWIIAVIISVTSNHFVFPMVDSWVGNLGRTLTKIDATEFLWNSAIMVDIFKYQIQFVNLMAIIKASQGDISVASHFFEVCQGEDECSNMMFKALYGKYNSSKYTTYVDYKEDMGIPSITCQVALGADLYCPYFGHLVASSKSELLFRGRNTFGGAEFFSLTARSESSASKETPASDSKCASHDNFDSVMSRTIMIQTMIFISTTFLYFLVSTISCIVDLKKNGFLKIMFQKGLSVRSYWMAVWAVTGLEILLISILLIISYAVQCPSFYKAASVILVFIAALLHLLGVAALSLLFTVIMMKLFHMGLAIVLISICASVVVLILRQFLPFSSVGAKIMLLFLLPLGHFGEFVQAHLLSVLHSDSVTSYHHLILAANFLFSVITIALTLYLDFILVTGNGYCLPYNYAFDSRFWISESTGGAPKADPLADELLPEMANFEPMTEGLRPIVRISQISRTFQSRLCLSRRAENATTALSNISAHIYESHITAIIGHNGSGKTTLLNILNGSDSPTSGRVSVNGLLVNDPINRIRLRRMIGICSQENSLSSALTVMQTLEMTLVSCNRGSEDSTNEVEHLLSALHLNDKRNQAVNKLSGGTMRQLCTAVALIGDSKVLFLDEPTSGVDPMSRRRVWKLLQEYKLKCSIILSTQSMDEADTLADRKIFLSGGALICAGSSLFLKSAFDCGFDFNVTLKSASQATLLIRQIQQEFPCVKVKTTFGTNVDFHLSATQINELPALAQALERRRELVTAFGLLQASLYDIFMRIRDLQPNAVEVLFKEGRIELVNEEEETAPTEKTERRQSTLSATFTEAENKVSPSILRCFRAMVYINVIRAFRSRVKLCSRIVTPIVLLLALLAMALVEMAENNSKLHLKATYAPFAGEFSKGVCIYQTGTKLDGAECASVFHRSTGADVKGYMALFMPDGTDLYDFLREPSRMDRIKALCQSTDNLPIECPIVYTNEWNKEFLNEDRRVSVGSFSTFEQFNSSFAASVTVRAYYKLAKYFVVDHPVVSKKIPTNAYMFTANSVYTFRSTFIPLYGIFVQLLIISIIPATFLDDLLEDKETKIRNQLSSIGMGPVNYWITMYLVHWLQYAAIYVMSVILVVALNSKGYANSFYLAGVVLPTLICGLSNNQLIVYILSSLLNKSNPIVTVTYFFFSIFLVAICLSVQLDNLVGVILIVTVPPFASIALTFHGTKAIFYTLSFFSVDSTGPVQSNLRTVFLSQPHILSSLIAIVIQALILPLLLSIIERRRMLTQMLVTCLRDDQLSAEEQSEDEGVKEEIERIDTTPRNADSLLETRHLKMIYPDGSKVVRDVTFSTAPGEIFGLLGPNGAGKSTIMSVIVGDLRATGGRCEVQCGEQWLASKLAARRGYIGYCPQYNPQYDNVTVREHLEFYACILGVGDAVAKNAIDILIQSLELKEQEMKMSCELSYGFKRRLSLAAALLGDPCLLVIDEASTGVDPSGKRVLWRSIRDLASNRRCIVISTHSMEEAEALCSRVCVMNYGLLVGMGSVQLLKTRYGQSYTLEVLIATDRTESMESIDLKRTALVEAVEKKFSDSSVVDEFVNRVSFSIPLSSINRLSHALSWLAEIKHSSHILYFSFYQMSLDQVFSRMITLHNKQVFLNHSDSIQSVGLTDEKQAAAKNV